MSTTTIHGRGASGNPANRFIPLYREAVPGWTEEEDPAPNTHYYHDSSKTILSTNDSPDVFFNYSVNPYRGCEHGCVYCYARPTHEYLELSAGLDFEAKIFVKEGAPELLRAELSSRKWVPQVVAMSGVTDPYQPIERRLELTRRCLKVFTEFRNPVGIVTKNALVSRDSDLLGELASFNAARVGLSITTLDPELARTMEPRASTPSARLRAIRELADAGVPAGVLVAPIIPGLNDHEAPAILQAAADAGATFGTYIVLRMPYGVKDLFETWLDQHYPNKKDRILGRIREVRDGKLNETDFGTRMRGEGKWADLFSTMFKLARKRAGLLDNAPEMSVGHFQNGRPVQKSLFD